MKRLSTALLLPLFLLSFFSSLQFAIAQKTVHEEITEGKEYWLGLPFCGRETNEAIRGDYPIALWISSKVDTRAMVTDAETGTVRNVIIRKNQITQVEYGDHVMMKESEVAKNYGIQVTADDPISVAVYMSYKWSGEAYRVIPVEWLGRKYVTMNLYQDQLLRDGEYRPPQILIVATDNDTRVTYRPTTETMKGIKPGAIGTVNLQKGQTFLILGSIKPNLSLDNSTDLTGTYIEANKPIAVISGHTKGAFPRYQFTFLGRNGGFMRNMLTDMVWPIELLGTQYISAPVKYADRPRGKIQDDLGDMIRFVATEDGTIVSQMRKDGTGLMQISPVLKRGQFYDIVNQEDAAYYSANKKVLVAQYGKTWWSGAVTPVTKPGDDEPQNPSRNGQGMLVVLAPVEQWTSYATWKSPEQIDNFIYVTFDADHRDHLYINGVKFTTRFGSAIKYLEGTKYAYLAESVAAGDHYMYGDTLPGTDGKEKARFAAYAYGNWDRSKDGFAYGYPIGINYNSPCDDSLVVTDTMICGNVVGNARVLPPNADCAFLYNILSDSLNNYNLVVDPKFKPGDSKTATYYLNVVDPKKYAFGIVKVQTKSGKTQYHRYEYWPEEIAYVPNEVDFGQLQEGDNVCNRTFDIINVSPKVPVTISKLYLKNSRPEFKINETSAQHPLVFPFTLQPGERKTVEVCADAPVYTKETVRDFVIAELSCYEWPQAELRYRMGDPVVWIGDAKWQNIPVGNLVQRDVQIINRSDVDVVLTRMTWPDADKAIFPKIEGLPCGPQGGDFTQPLTLKPFAEMTFTTFYQPDAVGNHKTEALFEGNTTRDKLNSIWEGNSIDVGPGIIGYDWQKKRIVDNKWVTNKYTGEVEIFCIGNTKINVSRVYIKDDPDGVFSLDDKFVPTELLPNQSVKLPAFFEPKGEKDYVVKVVFEAEFNNNKIEVEADLAGTGIQPHILITGHEFTQPLYVGNSANDYAKVEHNNPNPGYSMILTVNDLRIVGPDAAAFELDRALIDAQLPMELNPGQVWDIPVKFTALRSGKHIATLKANNWDEVNGVNPDQDAPEIAEGELIGYGYTQGLVTTDHDYGTLFRSVSANGQVYLVNEGSSPVNITRDIDASLLGNINAFNVGMMNWYTSGGNIRPLAPFSLAPNETLFVDVRFTALDVGVYNGQIEYKTDIGDAYSNLVGRGKIFRMVATIPTGYQADPGVPVEISYLIRRAQGETGTFEEADIKEFKAIIHFKDQSRQDAQDVYPRMSNPPNYDCADLITNGTLLQGWTCEYAQIVNQGKTLQAYFKNTNEPIKGEGVLFKFMMDTYLSDLNMVPLPHELQIQGQPAQYVEVEIEPGNIKITPVCVNTLRLIQLSNVEYGLKQNTPNPAENSTRIEYSVGINAPATLTLYNAQGERVATLIDQMHKPGKYEITLDIERLGLSSGAYFYKMESGPFTDSKTLIINK